MFVIDFKPLDFDKVDISDLFTLLNYDIIDNDCCFNNLELINQIEALFDLNFDLIDNNGTNQAVIDLIELFNSEKAFYKAFELIIMQMTYNFIQKVLKDFFDEIELDLNEYGHLSNYYFDILDLSNKDFDIMTNNEKKAIIKAYIHNNIKLDSYLDYDFIKLLDLKVKLF